jgi:hypothetical protein
MWVFVLPLDPRKEDGKLISIEEQGHLFRARSGPWGRGPLPPGRYVLGKPTALDPEAERNDPFTDEEGNAWWCPITPQFTTDRKSLGIHPDGSVNGTKGCIGVVGRNTLGVFNLLREGDSLVVVA